jgi:hypothetical protein
MDEVFIEKVIYFELSSHNISQFKEGTARFALTRGRMLKTEVAQLIS